MLGNFNPENCGKLGTIENSGGSFHINCIDAARTISQHYLSDNAVYPIFLNLLLKGVLFISAE